jgi:hypothetical protein
LSCGRACLVCQHRRGDAVTVEIDHSAGEEIQRDWPELHDPPWDEPAFVLVGALSHSGRFSGRVLRADDVRAPRPRDARGARRAGRHARVWTTDRMATM